MSSQRGNVSRSRQQKHKNATGYKNDLHNKTKQMVTINKTELPCLCQKCKEIIEWKIKYGKYKPLTLPRKCNKCQEKSVKKPYYTVCIPCGTDSEICCKCGEKKEVVLKPGLSAAEQAAEDSRLAQELKMLTERQRRQFFRLQEKGELNVKFEDEEAISNKFSDEEYEADDDSCDSSDHVECTTSRNRSNSETDVTGEISQPALCMKLETDLKLTT